MQKTFGNSDLGIGEYAESTFHPENELKAWIRSESSKRGFPQIHLGAMDGLHLEVISRIIRPKRAVEIGTLCGYSALSLAAGLADGGILHTFEMSAPHAELAREAFRRAGLQDRIQLYLGEALKELPKIESSAPFDLVFIDADKVNYPKYFEWAAKHLRKGGVMIGDNTFAFGDIAMKPPYPKESEASIQALRKFNQLCATPPFRGTVIPTSEGLTVAIKT